MDVPPEAPPLKTERMLEAARLFAQGVHNEPIADRLKIDSRKVRPLLEEAVAWLLAQRERLALVESVQTPQNQLEQQLRERFPHLQKVHVEPAGQVTFDADYTELIRKWGKAAAHYFDTLADYAEQRDTELEVGIGGGETILEAMTQIPDRPRPRVHFHALAVIGRGSLYSSSHVGPETNTTIAWARSGREPGHLHYGTAPPYDTTTLKTEYCSREGRRVWIAEELGEVAALDPIKQILSDAKNIEIAFAGLGMVNPSGTNLAYSEHQIDRLTMTGLLKPLGIKPGELAGEGAVGDQNYGLFNAEGDDLPRDPKGNILPRRNWRFFLTPGYDPDPENDPGSGIQFFRQMVDDGKKVIAIAGVHKEPAIRAALKGKLFNVWFTDEVTARNILGSP